MVRHRSAEIENYEEPTGDQLWERIAQDLPAKKSRKAVVVRIAAIVSACAALFAGVFFLTSRPDASQKQASRPSLVSTADRSEKPATTAAAPNILTASSLIDSPSAIAETRSNRTRKPRPPHCRMRKPANKQAGLQKQKPHSPPQIPPIRPKPSKLLHPPTRSDCSNADSTTTVTLRNRQSRKNCRSEKATIKNGTLQ